MRYWTGFWQIAGISEAERYRKRKRKGRWNKDTLDPLLNLLRARPATVHVCSVLSRVWLFATPWTVARQAPLSMGFSRQDYWSGVPWPSPKHVSQIFIRHHTWAWSQRLVYGGIVCVLCKGLGQMGLEREGICLPGPCILEVAVPTRGFAARCHLGWGWSVLWPVSAWGVGWEVLFVIRLPTGGVSFKIYFEEAKMTCSPTSHCE